jgi:hypothetical protein
MKIKILDIGRRWGHVVKRYPSLQHGILRFGADKSTSAMLIAGCLASISPPALVARISRRGPWWHAGNASHDLRVHESSLESRKASPGLREPRLMSESATRLRMDDLVSRAPWDMPKGRQVRMNPTASSIRKDRTQRARGTSIPGAEETKRTESHGEEQQGDRDHRPHRRDGE